jgi:hypothetical protein
MTTGAALRLRARVRDGRIVTDDPVELPEGTAVDVLVADVDDDLDDADIAALHAALAEADAEAARGELVDASHVIAKLRARG